MPEADKRSLLQALQQFHNYYLEKKYNNYWQLFADVGQHGVHVILHGSGHVGNVLIAHEAAVAVVAANGEGTDVIAPADQVLHNPDFAPRLKKR